MQPGSSSSNTCKRPSATRDTSLSLNPPPNAIDYSTGESILSDHYWGINSADPSWLADNYKSMRYPVNVGPGVNIENKCWSGQTHFIPPYSVLGTQAKDFYFDKSDYWSHFFPDSATYSAAEKMILAATEGAGSLLGDMNVNYDLNPAHSGGTPTSVRVDDFADNWNTSLRNQTAASMLTSDSAPEQIKYANRATYTDVYRPSDNGWQVPSGIDNDQVVEGRSYTYGYSHMRYLLYLLLTSPDETGKCRETFKIGTATVKNPYYEACQYGRNDSPLGDCGWSRATGQTQTQSLCTDTGTGLAGDALFVESWLARQDPTWLPCVQYFYVPVGATRHANLSNKDGWKRERISIKWAAVPNPNYAQCMETQKAVTTQPVIPAGSNGQKIAVYAPQGMPLPDGIENAGSTIPSKQATRRCHLGDVVHKVNGCKNVGDTMQLQATKESAESAVAKIKNGKWVVYNPVQKLCQYSETNGAGTYNTLTECQQDNQGGGGGCGGGGSNTIMFIVIAALALLGIRLSLK